MIQKKKFSFVILFYLLTSATAFAQFMYPPLTLPTSRVGWKYENIKFVNLQGQCLTDTSEAENVSRDISWLECTANNVYQRWTYENVDQYDVADDDDYWYNDASAIVYRFTDS